MFVKICCISTLREAGLAISAGAAALGLVGPMPSGPGVIDDLDIARIAAAAPATVRTFLLTSETDVDQIAEHHRRTRTTTIQLVDRPTRGTYADLHAMLPDVELVQVIHVLDESSVDEALTAAAAGADALLLDSGDPRLAVKVLGGTGRTHNWQLSRRIVNQAPVPVFLAGGLHAGNVGRAIAEVHPYGLDLCSGVRTHHALDPAKLLAFFTAVYSAIDSGADSPGL